VKKLIPLLLLTVLVGCAYYNADDPAEWRKFWEVESDFRICTNVYPSFESRNFAIARSLDYRIGAFEEIENEMNRRGLVCSERFPSFDEFKGKSQLQLLKEKKASENSN
tara:strand:- start:396 stop:722 length:327 start_codon:yes stop_codon:yes gene_type:complete